MESTIVYWGYIGIMEKKMETTIVFFSIIPIYGDKPLNLKPLSPKP